VVNLNGEMMEILNVTDEGVSLLRMDDNANKRLESLVKGDLIVVQETDCTKLVADTKVIQRPFLDICVSQCNNLALLKLLEKGAISQKLRLSSLTELSKNSETIDAKKNCIVTLLNSGMFYKNEAVIKSILQIISEVLKDIESLQMVIEHSEGNMAVYLFCADHVVASPSPPQPFDLHVLKLVLHEKLGFKFDMVLPNYENGSLVEGSLLLHAIARGNIQIALRLLKAPISPNHWTNFKLRNGMDSDAIGWNISGNPILVVLYFFIFAKSFSSPKLLLAMFQGLKKSGAVETYDLQPCGEIPLITLCTLTDKKLQFRVREGILQLLAAGADPNIPDEDGATPLTCCVMYRNAKLLKVLATVKCDFGDAFLLGCSMGHVEEMETLIGFGATLSSVQLAKCLKNGFSDIGSNAKKLVLFKKLVGGLEDPLDRIFIDLWTMSKDICDAELLTVLLESGANPIAVGEGSCPMLECIYDCNVDLLKVFLQKVDPNEIILGETLVVLATRAGARESLQVILDAGGDPNRFSGPSARKRNGLMTAVERGSEELVQLFLKQEKVVVNEISTGVSALHLACVGTSVKIVQALLDAGADVNLTDSYGSGPLAWACVAGNLEVMNLLTKSGKCRIDATDSDGCKALDICVKQGNFEGVKLLVESGADVGY